MGTQLALVDQTLLGLVDEFNRIFDGQDVAFEGVVEKVQHGGQRRGFSRAGRTGHQHKALFLVAKFPKDRRHAELFEGQDLGRNGPKHRRFAPALHEHVDPEAGDFSHLEREVAFVLFLEDLALGVVHHVEDHVVDLLLGQGGIVQFLELPVDAQHEGLA